MSKIDISQIVAKGPAAYRELITAARELDRSGTPVAFVHSGEPNFDTPAHIRQAAIAAMEAGHTHYVPNIGIAELREVIADKLSRENQITADPGSEIIVTNGAALGLWLALMVTLQPGDEVLLFSPTFNSFSEMVELAGGRVVFAPKVRQAGRFSLDKAEIVKKITPHTRAIMINTPNNPTGAVYRRDELALIAEVANANDLIIIADETYEKLVYEPHRHFSIAALAPEVQARTVTVYSFSKAYAMTGWRLGYVAANQRLTKAMSHLYQNSARCATAFVQMAGIAALQGSEASVQAMLREYTARRELSVTGLNGIGGLHCDQPEGAFYVFPDISEFGLTAWEFAGYLLRQAQVLTMPGSLYGPGGEGHLRLSFSGSRESIEQALEGIARTVRELGGG